MNTNVKQNKPNVVMIVVALAIGAAIVAHVFITLAWLYTLGSGGYYDISYTNTEKLTATYKKERYVTTDCPESIVVEDILLEEFDDACFIDGSSRIYVVFEMDNGILLVPWPNYYPGGERPLAYYMVKK